jgi:hypothetical protein
MIVLVAAAVCPSPPLLVPELAAGSAAELDDLRAACLTAIDAVELAAPELLVVVGAGAATRRYEAGSSGSFAPYGVPVEVCLPGRAAAEPPVLPLPLAVGAWLLQRAGWPGQAVGQLVAEAASAEECATLGAALAEEADRVALLVMGDGSARRSEQAPRPYDASAETFDQGVVQAFRSADPAGLLGLDAALATSLVASGRPAWQVLGGAAGEAALDDEVLYDRAPYGVGYIVAIWERHG